MTDIKTLIKEIKKVDPTLVNFLDTIFTLIEGSSSNDPRKRLSGKGIVGELARLPLLALRSKIILALFSDFEDDTNDIPIDSGLISIDGYNLGLDGEPIKDEENSEDDYNLGIRDDDSKGNYEQVRKMIGMNETNDSKKETSK
jgi:hypothetical protein